MDGEKRKMNAIVSRDQFLFLLNEYLTLEYAAYVQYKQHAAVIDGLYFAFADILLEHAADESKHAEALSNHLNYLGIVPTANVSERKVSPMSAEMLNQDLSGENVAITRYTERIAQSRMLQDFGTEAILLDILKDEQEHANDIETILQVRK
jgi:bacterioferritin